MFTNFCSLPNTVVACDIRLFQNSVSRVSSNFEIISVAKIISFQFQTWWLACEKNTEMIMKLFQNNYISHVTTVKSKTFCFHVLFLLYYTVCPLAGCCVVFLMNKRVHKTSSA